MAGRRGAGLDRIPFGLSARRGIGGIGNGPATLWAMSKRTKKKKAKVRRSKANHGRKPNAGRNK